MVTDWTRYPNFSADEFRCKHTGLCNMDQGFMARLQQLRSAYGRPMRVTSGYRHPTHPIEAAKSAPGAHTTGRAVDIACNGQQAFALVKLAIEHGFTGVGISQRAGVARFIHLDDLDWPIRPNIWSY